MYYTVRRCAPVHTRVVITSPYIVKYNVVVTIHYRRAESTPRVGLETVDYYLRVLYGRAHPASAPRRRRRRRYSLVDLLGNPRSPKQVVHGRRGVYVPDYR